MLCFSITTHQSRASSKFSWFWTSSSDSIKWNFNNWQHKWYLQTPASRCGLLSFPHCFLRDRLKIETNCSTSRQHPFHKACSTYLLTNIIAGRAKKLNKDWHGTMINDDSCVIWCSRCNVGESPRCFKLTSINKFTQHQLMHSMDDTRRTKEIPYPIYNVDRKVDNQGKAYR